MPSLIVKVTAEPLLLIVPPPANEFTISALPQTSSIAAAASDRSDASGMTPAAPSFNVPALMIVSPVYVFAPSSVNVPTPWPLELVFVNPNDPPLSPITPLIVSGSSFPLSKFTSMLALPVRVIAPDKVLSPSELWIVPARLNGSATVPPAPSCSCSVAPLEMLVPAPLPVVPSPFAFNNVRVPLVMLIAPL